MPNSMSGFVDLLSPERLLQVRELHRVKTKWNWIGVAFFGAWMAAAYWMSLRPFAVVQCIGVLTIAVVIHGLINLMHEGIHGSLSRNRRLNRLLGFVFGAPALLSVTAYGVVHLRHHRYVRTDKDPDELTNVSRKPLILAMLCVMILLGGIFIMAMRTPLLAWSLARRSERRRIVGETVVIVMLALVVAIAAWKSGNLHQLFWFWLIPWYFAGVLAAARGLFEHVLMTPTEPIPETRTVTSTRLLSLLNVNMNYHLEHHLFPGVPWYHLPRLHRLLQPRYGATEVVEVRRSYACLIGEAFRGQLAVRRCRTRDSEK